jgi:hypothetical protein
VHDQSGPTPSTDRAGGTVQSGQSRGEGPPGMLRLQQLAGNSAVAMLLQRDDDLDAGTSTQPTESTAPAETLTSEPAAEPNMSTQPVPDTGTSEQPPDTRTSEQPPDTPRARLELALTPPNRNRIMTLTDFSVATDDQRVILLSAMLIAPVDEEGSAQTVRAIWTSYGDRRARAASDHSDLWDRSNAQGANLPASWLGAGVGTQTVTAGENVGQWNYSVRGKFSYRITNSAIEIRVGHNFVPDAGVTVPTDTWFGYVRSTWNHYSAVKSTDPLQKRAIEFIPYAGADGHRIAVHAGSARANAAEYYAADSRAPNTIPHEFGHNIGLEDEYERNHADYARVTGEATPGGTGDETAAKAVATRIHTAIFDPEAVLEWHTTATARRRTLLQAIFTELRLPTYYSNGNTRQIAAQYKAEYTRELSADIATQIDRTSGQADFRDWREGVCGAFMYTNSSLMGNPDLATAGTPEHDHPVQPRHVRRFADIVQGFLGGTWNPVADH